MEFLLSMKSIVRRITFCHQTGGSQKKSKKRCRMRIWCLTSSFCYLCGLGKHFSQIMYACIILHDMIIEDERDSYYGACNDHIYDETNSGALVNYRQGPINEFAIMHYCLKADLTEHICQRYESKGVFG
jgi:hypothetical protein